MLFTLLSSPPVWSERLGPRMTRFLFRIEEATQLAFHAANHAHDYGGFIFVRKMKSAFKKDVALELVSQWHPAHDSPERQITYTGIRPGEKIHETLVSVEEMRRCEDQGDYYVIHRYTAVDCTYKQTNEAAFTSANAEMIRGEVLADVLEGAGCFEPDIDL